MATTFTFITSTILSTTTSSVVISSIPATYNDLYLVISARANSSSYYTNIQVQCNAATTTYSATMLYGNDSSGQGTLRNSNSFPLPRMGYANGGISLSNTFSNVEYYIPNYATSAAKQIGVLSVTEDNSNSGQTLMSASANLWSGTTAAINALTITALGNSFVSGSSFYLYGIKNS